ncbi:LLM class flavin-dependent oxidoreductase [Streptomyces sp. S1D4-11]|nr:LLM class flavin-dependent oxidoreductase [Streptomyces sp. S1D4-11]QIZ01118.1 LLM class flavin-dependent oxidoreductase [Streptomyces sp. S1D4-11]
MDISCQFATSLSTPEHIAVAESLGYRRAWLYDTPAQSPDVWAMLALAARQTERIGLGPGVLVPSLRHPMANAAGVAMLAALAPGRVAVAFGTGFNGTRALGAPPATWSYLKSYVLAVRALLRGETVDWDGHPMRMLHPEGHASARPIEVPILISALGPKGLAVAGEIADGLFSVNNQTDHAREFSWAALGIHGTVLDDQEPLDSSRVRAAAGAGHALAYHAAYEFGADVTQLPGGEDWLKVITAQPERERHLAVHDQHLVGLNQADEAAWAAGGWNAIPVTTVTGSPAHVAEQLARYADQGVTEIVYQPSGPDIDAELERFITVAQQS